jgi:hypothetical protein
VCRHSVILAHHSGPTELFLPSSQIAGETSMNFIERVFSVSLDGRIGRSGTFPFIIPTMAAGETWFSKTRSPLCS